MRVLLGKGRLAGPRGAENPHRLDPAALLDHLRAPISGLDLQAPCVNVFDLALCTDVFGAGKLRDQRFLVDLPFKEFVEQNLDVAVRSRPGHAGFDGGGRGGIIEVGANGARVVLVLRSRAVGLMAWIRKTVLDPGLPRLDALGLVAKRLRDASDGARVSELRHHMQMRGGGSACVGLVAVVSDPRIALRRKGRNLAIHIIDGSRQMGELLLVHHGTGLNR